MIDNIVLNARESMPRGGRLEISLSRVEPDAAPPVLSSASYLLMTVRDSGEGISKEHLPHIFEPFFTTRHPSSGLGLATSYSIIKKHDGYIEAESRLGAGSVFRIYLPEAEDIPKAVVPEEMKVRRGNGSILVMDDEDFILEVTLAMLQAIGYKAVSVRNGDEAIRRIREAAATHEFFSAAILDLMIPGGRGGKETVRELLAIDKDLKVVAASGYSDDPVMSCPDEFGFAASLAKPFRLAELDLLLKSLLS